MTKSVVAIRVDDELLSRIDEVAGSGRRSEFVRRALEAAVDGSVPRPDASGLRELARNEILDDIPTKAAPAGRRRVDRVKMPQAKVSSSKVLGSSMCPPASGKPRGKRLRSEVDADLLFEVLRVRGRMRRREAISTLGWMDLRFDRAESVLLRDRRITVVNSEMVVV